MPFDNPHQTPFGDLELMMEASGCISSRKAWVQAHDSPHFHTTPKVSANTGISASMTVNRSISGNSRASGILGIRS